LQRIAIVTGASSGVGAATAKLLSNDFHVIAVSRNIDKLKKIFDGYENIEPFAMDITKSSDIKLLYNYLKDKNVEVIVNNAGGGISISGDEGSNPNNWVEAFKLNVIGPMELSRSFIDQMKINKGHIIFVTSICAYYTFEGSSNYSAAKSAEAMLAETLRMELNRPGIRVTNIIPGTIDTDPDRPKIAALKPEDVAEAIRWSISMPKHVNIDSINIMHLDHLKYH
jgi:NADP-dependent 3-hydroxy acid dehydrogenase YdfG